MKGDFTRSTFDPSKGYTSVRMQQGRVQLDADWNEQVDIQNHYSRKMVGDLLGTSGVPRELPDSFEIHAPAGAPEVRPGRLWIDGVLCEEDASPAMDAPPADGTYLAYLDVWERHVSAIEDPQIRETALGGADSSTRTRTHCRVRFDQVAADATCLDLADWTDPGATTGTLAAQFRPSGVDVSDPCTVPTDAGYAGLENHLYRVEVHDGGEILGDGSAAPAGRPTFKWSRDNGAVAAEWLSSSGQQVIIRNPRQDSVRGFQNVPFWIEMSDDVSEADDVPGRVAEVHGYGEGSTGEAVLTLANGEPAADAPSAFHPKVRRWDSGLTDVDTTDWLDLEYGVQIQLTPGVYRSGDYWLIPARAFIGDFTGDIEWPQDGGQSPLSLPPHGVERRAAKLAVVRFESSSVAAIEDCREVFAPLAEQVTFTPAGGDGQTGLPGEDLPCALQVAVLQGKHPIEGARVRFTVVTGGGTLEDGVSTEIVTATGNDGVAGVTWQLPSVIMPFIGGSRQCLSVTARLLGPQGVEIAEPITFSADLRVASQVRFTPDPACDALIGYNDIESAINQVCIANGGGKRAIGEFNFTNPPNNDFNTVPLSFTPKYAWAVVAANAHMPTLNGMEVTGYAEFAADGTINQRCMHRSALNIGTSSDYYQFHWNPAESKSTWHPYLAHMRFYNSTSSPTREEYCTLSITDFDASGLVVTVNRFKTNEARASLDPDINGYIVVFG